MAKKKYSKLHEWQLKAQAGGFCKKCETHCARLTVDHVVPISILDALDESGLAIYEDEDNFELICQICNKFKSGRLDKRNPKTKLIIMKYL